jgi:hypothetical protein
MVPHNRIMVTRILLRIADGRHLSLQSSELLGSGECCSYFQAIYFLQNMY